MLAWTIAVGWGSVNHTFGGVIGGAPAIVDLSAPIPRGSANRGGVESGPPEQPIIFVSKALAL